jgi:hypothetical protein
MLKKNRYLVSGPKLNVDAEWSKTSNSFWANLKKHVKVPITAIIIFTSLDFQYGIGKNARKCLCTYTNIIFNYKTLPWKQVLGYSFHKLYIFLKNFFAHSVFRKRTYMNVVFSLMNPWQLTLRTIALYIN